MKRILVNAVLVLFFVALGVYCYNAGKGYSILLENLPYSASGAEQPEHPGIEALQVTLDGQGDPIFMLEGDRMIAKVTGSDHIMKIDILDEEDRVTETREVEFSVEDLGTDAGGTLFINVARAFALGRTEP